MALSAHDVARLADLARIDMTPDELAHLAPQLAVILEAVDRVREVAADDVPATSHALPLANVVRPDVVGECLTAEQALAMAPEAELDRFRVPRILGEGS